MVIIVAIVIFFLNTLVLRDIYKATVLTILIILVLFSYGHIYLWLNKNIKVLGRTIPLLIFFFLLILGFYVLIRNSKLDYKQSITPLGIVLLAVTLVSAVPAINTLSNYEGLKDGVNKKPITRVKENVSLPDVYLIISDSYPRQDVLKDQYHFDNSNFLGDLEDEGFRVIPCSQSNYYNTWESLYSMLNLKYLNEIPNNADTSYYRNIDYKAAQERVWDNELIKLMKSKGYTSVAFDTGFTYSEITTTDYYSVMPKDPSKITPFESVFLKTTIWNAIEIFQVKMGLVKDKKTTNLEIENIDDTPYYKYEEKMFSINQLEKSIYIPGPKFVFAHLLITHVPVLMDEFGIFIGNKEVNGTTYSNQLSYANKRLISIVKDIKKTSKITPIIVILGDHGLRELGKPYGVENLIAVYGPPALLKSLYSTITPINVMRLVANEAVGASYNKIDDITFWNETYNLYEKYELIHNNCTD